MTGLNPHHLVPIPPEGSTRVPARASGPTPPAAPVSSGGRWRRQRAERLRYRIARWLLDAVAVPPLATVATVFSQPTATAPALAGL
jgi:hypothetical protein